MDSDWDGGLKLLIGQAPQDFVSWLMQGATYVRQYSSELELHGLNADILYEVVLNGESCLLHIEFQSTGSADMAKRLLEYNVLAHRKYGLKVYSYVIYLVDRGTAASSPYTWESCCRKGPSCFHFEVIKLWDYSMADLKETGLKVLLPLLPLTRDSKKVDSVLDVVMTELDPLQDESCKELLVVAYGILSYTYKSEADQHKIRRRYAMLKDILRDSWGYQEIMQEGREEERLDLLYKHIEARFPELFKLAKERAALISNPVQLQKLTLEITLARDAEEVQRLLEAIE